MSRLKYPRRLIALLCLVLLFGAAIFTVKQLVGGSATGSITAGQSASVPKVEPTALVAQQGRYASFNYPVFLQPVAASAAASPVLVNYNFIKSQFGAWQLAIQIAQLETGNLNDNGSYHYRQTNPNQYVFSSTTVNGKPVPLVTDKTNTAFNQVVYLQRGNKVATVSLMGGNGQDRDQLESTMQTILNSWQWL